ERIDSALVSCYFDDRRSIWQQPIDRNVFGLLERFGDAELAAMIAPRTLVIEAACAPEITIPGEGGAPATLSSPPLHRVVRETEPAMSLTARIHGSHASTALVTSGDDGQGAFGSREALARFLDPHVGNRTVHVSGKPPESLAALPDSEARL